jgi:phosphopantetheine adenylyltransferase
MVKEVASFGGSVKSLVPEIVEKALKDKFKPIDIDKDD